MCHFLPNVIVRLTMTERCQTKFTEKFDNQNYIIYVGVISASLAVLYFYRCIWYTIQLSRLLLWVGESITRFLSCRFHFIAIALSYVLGCVACYYGLNSSVFRDYVRLLKSHFTGNAGEALEDDVPDKVTGLMFFVINDVRLLCLVWLTPL